ncbi:MAG: class I SAM-dependent methyltransferase [Patescibacteria group bacterium]
MSYANITSEQYELLYKRYFARSVDDLLLAGGSIEGKNIIDICAGTCRLSKRAIELKCGGVWTIEPSYNMIPKDFWEDNIGLNRISTFKIEDALSFYKHHPEFFGLSGPFDFAFCQQGINYWFDEKVLSDLVSILNPGAKFVFNTFNTRPEEKLTIKQYTIDGVGYCEVYQLDKDMVCHFQACDGIKPHYTEFKWISPETFDSVLNKVFKKVDCRIDGRTSIYVCEV